ncbi:hypothetical protein METHB2_430013 [Candidatus Methylobacter favarea]|uniref:Uncharacterized protein n=1 Tax=Candidatus Methylobacter favarea TaxID=2707345 RepID=A0A8S0X8U2_9GAMM|nr:hypothetical protein METHB2_430013 [Candidatus Methylobacter favarea]
MQEEQVTTELQRFVQQLCMQMMSTQATLFLIAEYLTMESESKPVFNMRAFSFCL